MLKSFDNYASVIWEDKLCSTLYQRNISAKIQKNIQKSDYMDGFCSQSELDLTLFYKIEEYFDNLKSLMTVTLMTGFMNTCTHIHHGEFARDD